MIYGIAFFLCLMHLQQCVADRFGRSGYFRSVIMKEFLLSQLYFSVECRCDVGVVVYASASCVLEIITQIAQWYTELELDPERNS